MGERCPGGETAIYLANNFLRFDDSSKLKEDKDFGIKGIMVNIQFIKSRTNEAGLSVPMVLNYEIGFDPELSALVLLKEKGRANAKGAYMSFDTYPDLKFTQKGFKNKLSTDQEFLQAFMIVYREELEKLMSSIAVVQRHDDNENKIDFTSMMLQDRFYSLLTPEKLLCSSL